MNDDLKKLIEAEAERLLQHMGECIFPQKLKYVADRFSEDVLVYSAQQGLIHPAISKGGRSVMSMKTPKGYIELTDKGWKIYKASQVRTP